MHRTKLSIVSMLALTAIILSLVALGFGGCATKAPAGDTLKIGYIGFLGSAPGLDHLHDVELGADIDNKAGGIEVGGKKYKVEVIVYDSENDQAKVVAATNKLIFEDKVNFICHDFFFSPAIVPIADQNKVMTFGVCMDESNIAPDKHYACTPWGQHTSQVIQSAWLAKNKPDLCKNIVMVVPDTQVGHMEELLIGGTWKAYGINTTWVYYPYGATDLSAVSTKVKTLNPTMVSSASGEPPVDGGVFKSLYQAGVKATFLGGGGMPLQLMATVCPVEALEGYLDLASPKEFDPAPIPEAKDWLVAWQEKYGKWEGQDFFEAMYYCIKAGVQEAKSFDTNEVAKVVMNGLKFKSAIGEVQMCTKPSVGNNRTADSVRDVYLKEIKGGKSTQLALIKVNEGLEYLRKLSPVETKAAPGELDFYK